ncbi:hypothetical protein Tco_0593613 [Tanacetum coccineum]
MSRLLQSLIGLIKPKRPLTPDPDWNASKSIDFRLPQTWISKIAQVEKPPLSFDKLTNTIDFSTYVMNHLKIDKLTQEHLVGPTFNLLKGTCKSRVELEYNFEECRQVVHVNFFINNDLEYLKGGTSTKKYTTSKTKTKAARYDIPDIEDMVPSSDISKRTPYTAYSNPQGIIYVDKFKRNRLMRSDELYMFSDGTLTSVRSVLHDIASNLRMDYLPKRRWSNLDR